MLLFTVFLSVGCGKKDSNNTQSVEKTRLAADQGIATAQTNLCFLYLRGEGVPQDDVQAHKWFKLASTRGDTEGTKNRDLVEKRMTPQQIAQSQELARNWKPKKQWG